MMRSAVRSRLAPPALTGFDRFSSESPFAATAVRHRPRYEDWPLIRYLAFSHKCEGARLKNTHSGRAFTPKRLQVPSLSRKSRRPFLDETRNPLAKIGAAERDD